jgi:hypothetical protein
LQSSKCAAGATAALPINASLYDKLNFDFVRDFAPVAGIMRVPNVMEVHPSVPAKTVIISLTNPVIITEPLIRCGLAPCTADPPGGTAQNRFWGPAASGGPTRAVGRTWIRPSPNLRDGPRAIEVLVELMTDPKRAASVRVMAADRILERGYGKPRQLNTTGAGQFRFPDMMTNDEKPFWRLTAGRAAASP